VRRAARSAGGGVVRVVLGQIGRARSRIGHAPPDLNYFHVRLKDGQRWRYAAPDGHNVTWLAVDRGACAWRRDGRVLREQVALFGRSPGVIEVQAEGESSFVLGSARQDSNALMQSGRLPIDTTVEAFVPGEMDGAAERPVAARPGPPLRIDLDRRLAPSKRR